MEQNQGMPTQQPAEAIAEALAQNEPVQPALMQPAPAPKKKRNPQSGFLFFLQYNGLEH